MYNCVLQPSTVHRAADNEGDLLKSSLLTKDRDRNKLRRCQEVGRCITCSSCSRFWAPVISSLIFTKATMTTTFSVFERETFTTDFAFF